MRLNPPKGMADILPEEMALRERAQGIILSTYADYGYRRVSTPAIEDAENLERSEGGDNLNLIYRILKRGDKLDAAAAEGAPLHDLGLRYDLTLPLARFFAANRSRLPYPFKCVQIDRAYRAERPQRGRMREFTQCDIDVLGDPTPRAEFELVAVTAEALARLGFTGLRARISDRRLLRALLAGFGFAEAELSGACVAFDKFDKIGASGVAEELSGRGLTPSAVEGFGGFLSTGDFSLSAVSKRIGNAPEAEALTKLIDDLNAVSSGAYTAEFDATLVRGQGYYTGAVFELEAPGYAGSVAGGGRYDGLIGKFTGSDAPAVGFSIGFERIMGILIERGWAAGEGKPRLALVYPPETPDPEVFAAIQPLRERYLVTAIAGDAGSGKLRKRLEREGYRLIAEPGGEAAALGGAGES